MTNEEKLITLRSEIIYHRRKAEQLRKRAAAQDAIADAKVKEAAALGTPALPAVENPVADGKTYPELARTAAYPPWKA